MNTNCQIYVKDEVTKELLLKSKPDFEEWPAIVVKGTAN